MSNVPNQRRIFIRNTAFSGLGLSMGLSSISIVFNSCTNQQHINIGGVLSTNPEQTPLSFDFNALEPVIDAQTMELHYTKHAAGYASKLKESIEEEKISGSLETALMKVSGYSTKFRNNGGGHYNHELFWKSMSPNGKGQPQGQLMTSIEKDFNSFDNFKSTFEEAAKTRFGSGWAWLVLDNNTLKIGSTPNQDNPLMDISEFKGIPLLGLDVWEHAYYLHYQNRRADYISNWWEVVNWDYVQSRFEAAKSS